MKRALLVPAGAALLVVAFVLFARAGTDGAVAPKPSAPPVLAVTLTRAAVSTMPVRIPASGTVAAWQEASVGAESDGLRLVGIEADVGDIVRRGQVLARFDAAVVEAELAEARASVAQAQAERVQADTDATRAKRLDVRGALSTQQVDQYVAAANTARARLDAARAVEARHRLRLAQTRVLAPSDGIVTSRTATVGAVVPAGTELFRLIRDGRLEWRAAVGSADLEKLAPGQTATIELQGRAAIRGTLRTIAPVIDAATLSGLLYVDLPPDSALRVGAFVRGHVDAGEATALTLPQNAVLLRDGFAYVMRVGPASNVVLTKVALGRRAGDRVEIAAGITAADAVIASGLGFLSEGDTVSVVGES